MLGKLTTLEIDQLLMTQVFGRIGCHADGRTYVVPVSYAYDGQRIIAHSADGQKLRMMRANPNVCFEVDQVENLANWRSVVAWGTFHELHEAEALAAMNLLVERLNAAPMSETMPSHGMPAKAPARAVVYAIDLKEKTGRFEKR